MRNKNWKIFSAIAMVLGALFLASTALAQGLGINEVGNGLGGSLGAANSDPREIAGKIINFSLGFLGLIAVGIILYAGFRWMTSGGSEEKIADAKKMLIAGVIGLAIILSSWGIATWLINRIGESVNGGGGYGYSDGDTQSCGCGGVMSYSNGSWGACIGSDCGGCYGLGCGQTSCDGSSIVSGCQATAQMCGDGNFCNDSCVCEPQGEVGDSCDADTENATCDADNNRCGEYLSCNPDTCLCAGSPVITSVSPIGGFCQNEQNKSCKTDADCSDFCNLSAPNGAPGNFITISGKSFGSYLDGTSKVIFLGNGTEKEADKPSVLNPSCTEFWSDTQIVVAVPNGVSSGAIRVIAADASADATNDERGPVIPDFRANGIIRPGLCTLTPVSGTLSKQVSYFGVNLYAGQAYFGNYEQNVPGLVSSFTNPAGLAGTSTIPNISSGDSGSFVKVALSGNFENSNYLAFKKEREEGEGPFISSFSPSSGNIGQYVTIYGSGFGGAKGSRKVFFGDVEADYVFPDVCLNSVWKNEQITVKVPAGLDDGDFVIKVDLEGEVISTDKINPNYFRFDKNLELKTSLCKIDPIRGPAGTPVSLWGEYFGREGSESTIKFNGSSANATSTITKDGRADKLQTFVPQTAVTGPVKVLKGGVYGNELNFSVGSCTSNADCGVQVCCPANTYKVGQCAASLDSCYVDVPSSVYEWQFSTSFSGDEEEVDSCAGLAKYLGACSVGSCPNVPGTCSPYLGGEVFVGDCKYDCSGVSACGISGSDCSYDVNSDKCLKNLGASPSCDLSEDFTYTLNGKELKTKKYCNADNKWEAIITSSCPDGFSRGQDNKCVQLDSTCYTCPSGLSCESVAGVSRCASPKLCASGSTCRDIPSSLDDKCVAAKDGSCDCCCTIGQSARDCCSYQKDGQTYQLECGSTCGSDTQDDGSGLGVCGGCASAGSDVISRDAACNCSGHSGQYCEVNSSAPAGYCTDCSKLSSESCLEHSNVCCLDANGTLDTSDDICRGGGENTIKEGPDKGYCAYYNCSTTEANSCDNINVFKIGTYSSQTKCQEACQEEPCVNLVSKDSCEADTRCCFDAANSKCRQGEQLTSGVDKGYCAYYGCQIPDGGDLESASCVASKTSSIGTYKSLVECGKYCPTPPSGAGQSCAGASVTSQNSNPATCNISVCNYPGFACLALDGSLGSSGTDCGTCCCQPKTATTEDSCKGVNDNLICLADKGSCTGANRGLCCGCSSDNECGSPESVGCGNDTCCEARPEITSSSPANLASGVCRNAVIKVGFNQLMDASSLLNNVVLVEEKSYGEGVCPSGQVALSDMQQMFAVNDNIFFKAKNIIASSWQKIVSFFGLKARKSFADSPSSDKLYCAVSGRIYIENTANDSSISFAPSALLSPSANHYLIVKGDEDLNSKTGVISLKGIGFNGEGYFDGASTTEAEFIKFNDKSYKNAAIIKFTTLSSDSPMSGICAVDRLSLEPASYLFRTSDDALNSDEDDTPGSRTFDTKADRDKAFTIKALSSNGQALQPVTGYFWDYSFDIINKSIASGTQVASDQYLVEAASGVSDGETNLEALLDMNRFSAAGSCNTNTSCSCSNESCPENCCNYYLGGDGFKASSDIYVFLCDNPWPAVAVDGSWSPWVDVSGNCNGGSSCPSYNYKFHYCRDAGAKGTLDDLPAIISNPVVRGQEGAFICSSDRNVNCSSGQERCGVDRNGDGTGDGFCVWSVLKESYFFRENLPSDGEITALTDLRTGGKVQVDWRSNADQADSYKVYYLKSGASAMLFKEVKAQEACRLEGLINVCSTIISGLSNDVNYLFKVSVVSASKAESAAANEKIVMPTDKTAPSIPVSLGAELVASSTVVISWTENTDDTVLYRLYRGIRPTAYAESYDTAKKKPGIALNSLSFPNSAFSSGLNYFALSALDSYGNESEKSIEIEFDNNITYEEEF